jgi:large subunit ribosomal protein L24
MNKIIKGDEVVVIAGKDKGKRGTVLSRVDATHLLVEGVNVVKKHQKPNPMKGLTGGVVDKTMPIDQSNIALWNAGTAAAKGKKKKADAATDGKSAGHADRVGFQVKDGKKVRVFRSSGEAVSA